MVQIEFEYVVEYALSVNKVDNANEVAAFVPDGMSLHEVGMASDRIEKVRLLLGGPLCFDEKEPDSGGKGLVEYQLDDLLGSLREVEDILDPRLGLVIQSESSFLGVTEDVVVVSVEAQDIPRNDIEDVRGVFEYSRRAVDSSTADFFDPVFELGQRFEYHWNSYTPKT